MILTSTCSGVSASPLSSLCSFKSKIKVSCCNYASSLSSVITHSSCFSDKKLKKQLGSLGFGPPTVLDSHRGSLRCNSSTGPGSGDNESRTVLDAFFLGKALAEALNERVESAVGEFLSTIGRLQAEQQRQIQDFQDDVLERARKAKEKAAHEAMETKGLVRNPTTVDAPVAVDTLTTSSSSSASIVTTTNSSPDSIITSASEKGQDPASKGPV